MTLFDRFVERARSRPPRIVLPEGEDERVLIAATRAAAGGIASITLLGAAQRIQERIDREPAARGRIDVIDPSGDIDAAYADELHRIRAHKGMTAHQARQAVRDPLTLANMMTRTGACGGTVAGAVYPTSDVVRAALQLIGRKEGCDLVSSFFIMAFERPFHPSLALMVFADCALVIDPSSEELAQIAIQSADSARELVGIEPRIALLSFSTDGSAEHPAVDKVAAAAALLAARRPDLHAVGDIQLDAAIIPEILHRKSKRMRLSEPANVLIFPNLDAGNIGYKLAERFGQAQAIGPILQGLNRPANDLSRGCSAEDIYKIITVTAVQAQGE